MVGAVTVTNLAATQLSNTAIEVSWSGDDAVTQWNIARDDDGAGGTLIVEALPVGVRSFFDTSPPAAGVSTVYSLVDLAVATYVTPALVVGDLDTEPTYGQVDPLSSTIRYTTLEAVKAAMGVTDATADAAITQAIIASEVAIDVLNSRSFPDTGTNPEIDGVPEGIRVWALDASIAVYKLRDTTAGFSAGSDDWIGAIDVSEQARRALRRNPLALGWKIAWGLA